MQGTQTPTEVHPRYIWGCTSGGETSHKHDNKDLASRSGGETAHKHNNKELASRLRHYGNGNLPGMRVNTRYRPPPKAHPREKDVWKLGQTGWVRFLSVLVSTLRTDCRAFKVTVYYSHTHARTHWHIGSHTHAHACADASLVVHICTS